MISVYGSFEGNCQRIVRILVAIVSVLSIERILVSLVINCYQKTNIYNKRLYLRYMTNFCYL